MPNLGGGAEEVQVLPVSNARLELDAQQVGEAENRGALTLRVSVNRIGLDVRGVFLDEIQNVVSLP